MSFISSLGESDHEIIGLFLDGGVDPNETPEREVPDRTPFVQFSTVTFLLEARATVDSLHVYNADGNNYRETALHMAVKKGSLEKVKLLLDWQADINAIRNVDLISTRKIDRNRIEKIDFFYAPRGVNVTNIHFRETSLHLAIENKHEEMVRFLLVNGADTSIPNTKADRTHTKENQPESCFDLNTSSVSLFDKQLKNQT